MEEPQRTFRTLPKNNKRAAIDIDGEASAAPAKTPRWASRKLCATSPSTSAAGQDQWSSQVQPPRAATQATLHEIVQPKVCPKQFAENIGEYVAIAAAMQRAISLRWQAKKVTTLFVLLRGVRGEEGVRICADKIFDEQLDVEDPKRLAAFAEAMIELYNERVSRDGKRSFLSHGEAFHRGLSGVHFIRALLLEEQLALIEKLAGELVVFWEKAAAKTIRRQDLLDCYAIFDKSNLMLYACPPDEEKKFKTRRLRRGSYNSMDFFRTFYNCWATVLRQPDVVPCNAFWEKVLLSQKDPEETKNLLSDFGLSEYFALSAFLSSGCGVTWTTLLVLLCEVRQATRELTTRGFDSLVWKVLESAHLQQEVERTTADIKRIGATGSLCFCTRLCVQLRGLTSQDGMDVD